MDCCKSCGTPLLVRDRYRLLQPLRPLNPHYYTEVFEVGDRNSRKVMKILKSHHPELVNRFEREAMTLQELNHPRIPTVEFDDYFTFTPANQSQPLHCLVMEKIEGKNLDQYIAHHGPISSNIALQWLRQCIEILDILHGQQFFHRDIKPSNIMLKPDGKLVLIDLGSVRAITSTYLAKIKGQLNVTTVISGGYTPPEQIEGKALPQSDFFALGRTFVYLLAGKSPSQLPTDAKTGQLIWRNQAPQVSRPLADFIDELMNFIPANRPQNTRVILRDLTRKGLLLKSVQRALNSPQFKYALMGLLTVGAVYRLSFPVQAQYYYQVARSAHREGELQRAKRYYEKSLQFDARDSRVYNNLGRICELQSQAECAALNYHRALEVEPENSLARYNLAGFYDEGGNLQRAEREYELVARSQSPLAVSALSNWARLRILNADPDKAIALSLQGLQKTDTSKVKSALHKNLGWAYWMQADYDRAQTHLQQAIALNENRTDAYCLLAQVLEVQGDREKALDRWQNCWELEYSNPDVRLWRTLAKQRLKQADLL